MSNKKWDYTFEIRKQIKKGTLLLSEPYMQDDFFQRSVCYVCSHSRNEGTFGFILNKPIEKKIGEFVPELKDWDQTVYYGGPVGTDSLHFVHKNNPEIEDAVDIGNGLFWNGNFEQLKILLKSNQIDKKEIRLFIGYSGWEKNQLRNEIINNSWIVVNDYKEDLLNSDQSLWNNVLKKMDAIYKEMAYFPIHPNMN